MNNLFSTKSSIVLIIANNSVFMTASFSPLVNGLNPRVSGVHNYCVIVRVRIVMKRTVVGNYSRDYLGRWYLGNLGKGLTQSAIKSHLFTSIVYLDRVHSPVREDSPWTKVPGRSRWRVWGVHTPHPWNEAFFFVLALFAFNFKYFVYLTSHLCHPLVIYPCLRKVLHLPLKHGNFVSLEFSSQAKWPWWECKMKGCTRLTKYLVFVALFNELNI